MWAAVRVNRRAARMAWVETLGGSVRAGDVVDEGGAPGIL
jgi:hypothetical protein